jgi:hypothetical protein
MGKKGLMSMIGQLVGLYPCFCVGYGVMLFNATFNNISVISWQSVLLVEETGVHGENHRQTVSHNVVSSTPRHERYMN